MTDDAAIRAAVARHAAAHGLDPAVVYGMCLQESSGDWRAARYEPGYRWTLPDAKRPVNCTLATELVEQSISWGIMQVMGATLREHGYTGWLHEIAADLDAQIDYGCRYLSRQARRYGGAVAPAVAAYNAGSARLRADGRFVNQHYVDRVLRFARQWEG